MVSASRSCTPLRQHVVIQCYPGDRHLTWRHGDVNLTQRPDNKYLLTFLWRYVQLATTTTTLDHWVASQNLRNKRNINCYEIIRTHILPLHQACSWLWWGVRAYLDSRSRRSCLCQSAEWYPSLRPHRFFRSNSWWLVSIHRTISYRYHRRQKLLKKKKHKQTSWCHT